MTENAPPAQTPEQALERYTDLLLTGARPDPEEFLARQAPAVQERLRQMLARLGALRQQLESAPEALSAGRVLGDYRLLRELGRGGMGVVWEAEQRSLRRRVALKVLAPELQLSPSRRERFRREAEAGSRVAHPALVTVHAVGEEQGTLYIAQELIPGGRSLSDEIAALREAGELPAGYYRRCAERTAALADGLHALHEAGVIHRDVKPGNVLLAPDGAWKLNDFGLARVEDALSLTHSKDYAGTPFYMSPEQVERGGTAADARSDVFSLGITLYELLTLARPFHGDTSRQVMERILREDPPDPRKLHAGVPRELALICLKALEKPPQRRYATAAALAADLRRFLRREPIAARPLGPAPRAAKWARRHPALSATGAVAAAALVLMSLLTLQYRSARDQARIEASSKEAVADFMVDLFAEAYPGAGHPAGMTTGDLLLRGRDRLPQYLAGKDLLVQANLEHALGNSLMGQGRYADAEPLLEQALATRCSALGEDHAESIQARITLTMLRFHQGRLGEAEALARRAVAGSEGHLDEAHELRLLCRGTLAWCLDAQGRFGEALELATSAFADSERSLGAQHAITQSAGLIRALSLQRLNRIAEARGLYLELLERGRQARGDLDPYVLNVLACLGDLELASFEASAEERFRAVADGGTVVFGRGHPLVLSARERLATLALLRGAVIEAERELRNLVADLAELYPASAKEVINARGSLAHAWVILGRGDEAVEMLEAALQACQAAHGAAHPLTLHLRATLGRTYADIDDEGRARPLLESTLNDFDAAGYRDQQVIAMMCSYLATYYIHQSEFSAADRVLERARQAMTSVPSVRDPNLIQVYGFSAYTKVQLGEHLAAFDFLQRQHELAQALQQPIHDPLDDELAMPIVRGLAAAGQLEAAAAAARSLSSWSGAAVRAQLQEWLAARPEAPELP